MLQIYRNLQPSEELSALCQQILARGLDWKDHLTDYEVDITATHLASYFALLQPSGDSKSFSTASLSLLDRLVAAIDEDAAKMHESSDFTTYFIPTCQSAMRALSLIVSSHPSLLDDMKRCKKLLKSSFLIFHETLNVVADSDIFAGEENSEDPLSSLLSKGPIQPSLGANSPSENIPIAKNKLDCRGHIIGEADPQQTERLKRLMLSSWLTCKHSVLLVSSIVTLLDDKSFEKSKETHPRALDAVRTYLRNDSVDENETVLTTDDVIFLVWDLLGSMLTIKHIGGIVFVADAITSILKRVTSLGPWNSLLAG